MFYPTEGGREKNPFSVSRDALVPFIAIHEHIFSFTFMKVEKCDVARQTFNVCQHLLLTGNHFGVGIFFFI